MRSPAPLLLALLLFAPSATAAPDVGPIFDPFEVDSVAADAFAAPAAAYDGIGKWLIVYRSAPGELRAQYRTSTGDPVGADFLVRDTAATGQIGPPSVGVLDDSPVGKRFVVTWSREANIAQDREIEFMLLAPGVTAAGTVVPLTDTGTAIEDVEPRVAPRARGFTTIVWNRVGQGIQGANVGSDVAGVGTIEGTFPLSSDAADSHPDVVRCGEATSDSHLAVWHRDDPGAKQSLRARYWDGGSPSVSETEFEAHGSPLLALGPPDLASSRCDDFFLVWHEQEPIGGASPPNDVRGRRIFVPGSAPRLGPVVGVSDEVGREELEPEVVFSGNAYLVGLRLASGVEWVLGTVSVDVLNGNVVASFPIDEATELRGFGLASRSSHAIDIDVGVVVWSEPAGGGEGVSGQFVEAPGGRAVAIEGSGCEILGGVPVLGTAAEQNPGFRMELWDGEPNGAPYMVVGDGLLLVTIGGAILVPDPSVASVFFGGVIDVEGYTGVDVPLPPAATGLSLNGQWFTLSQGFGCTGYIISLSDGFLLRVE